MVISVEAADYAAFPCAALLVGCREDNPLGDPLLARIDQLLQGAIASLVQSREITGELNRITILHTLGRLPAERIVLVGLGNSGALTPERLRQVGGSAVKALKGAGVSRAASVVHRAAGVPPTSVADIAQGLSLGAYSFDIYKTKPDTTVPVAELVNLFEPGTDTADAERLLAADATICEAVSFARDLVSQPGNVATPLFLAEKALEFSARLGIACTVLDRDEMERQGMGGILSVAKGSHQLPRFIVLEYRGGSADKRPTVLVGKGITFDSGGISLKPREGMERMKDDMAGAAAVMGAVMAVAGLRLPVNVIGLVPAAENLPGGGAYKPGDIVRTMSGQTVEIVNTDAEGRMILSDALFYAQRFKPAAVIDLATLTGACLVALGSAASGVMGNDPALVKLLRRAGEATGERLWELPLWDEYGEIMKSDVADLKNAGGPHAGTITAAWFLQRFVGKSRWAHVDIAGTAWEEKGRPYQPKGATGVGVRLLVEYLKATVR